MDYTCYVIQDTTFTWPASLTKVELGICDYEVKNPPESDDDICAFIASLPKWSTQPPTLSYYHREHIDLERVRCLNH